MSKRKGIYPCFQSKIKYIETYKNFYQGEWYDIIGFGTSKRQGKKALVWTIQNLDDKETFTIIKTTLNILVDRGIIKEDYAKMQKPKM